MPYVKPNIDPNSPKDGKTNLKIFDPDLKDFLPDEGRNVPDSPYWHRLIRDADVIEGSQPAPPKK